MLLNPLQLSACSPGSLPTCCFGVTVGASQAAGGCMSSPPQGCELCWLISCSGNPWEKEASPVGFFSPHLFSLCTSPPMQGAGQGSLLSWGVKGMHELPWGGRTAGHWAACWHWLHRGTAAPVRGLCCQQLGSHRQFRGGKLCCLVFAVSGSFTYLPLLHHVDEACIWAYCHNTISSWVDSSGLAVWMRISTKISWFSINRLRCSSHKTN